VMALLGAKAWWMPRWLNRILPHFDIEGEAVERELSLAEWPEPHTTAALVGEGLAVTADGGRAAGEVALFDHAAFRVERGGTLIATGDPRAARAFALALAGRLAPTDGRLRVAGHLLPERAAWVRGHVGLALLGDVDDRVDAVRHGLKGASIVVIDGVDSLDAAERDQAAALIRDAAEKRLERAGDAASRLTLVVTSRTESAALALLADVHRPDVTSVSLRVQGAASTISTESPTAEVNA